MIEEPAGPAINDLGSRWLKDSSATAQSNSVTCRKAAKAYKIIK
jgi:hypothetical protein